MANSAALVLPPLCTVVDSSPTAVSSGLVKREDIMDRICSSQEKRRGEDENKKKKKRKEERKENKETKG